VSESPEFTEWVRRYNGLAFLHPQWRLLYVSVPKAAGTSLNIALTRSAGIDFPGTFVQSLGEESLVSQTIWDGEVGGRPMVESLGDVAYKRLMRGGLRHVFTVVRHPVERLLTTWSSKYLVRAPYYRARLGLPDPGLRRFDTVEEVLADLDQLVKHLHADPTLVHRDVHLVSQHELLRRDLSRFDHVGRTDRLGETIDWLRGRLASEGVRRALCVNQQVGNTGLDARCRGLAAAMRAAGGSSRVLAVDDQSAATPQRIASAIVAGRIDGVLALNATSGIEAVQGAERAGIAGRVKIATFDLGPDVLNAVRAHRLVFAVDQQAYLQGYLPVVLLAQRARYGLITAQGDVIPTGPNFVTAANAAQAIELSRRSIR